MHINDNIIELAKTQARKSTMRHKHGAVLMDKRGNILNTGYNQPTTAPSQKTRSHCIHSEQSALTGLRHDSIRGSIMLIVRVNDSDELRMSRPCKRCEGLLRRKGVAKIIYSTSGSYLLAERL